VFQWARLLAPDLPNISPPQQPDCGFVEICIWELGVNADRMWKHELTSLALSPTKAIDSTPSVCDYLFVPHLSVCLLLLEHASDVHRRIAQSVHFRLARDINSQSHTLVCPIRLTPHLTTSPPPLSTLILYALHTQGSNPQGIRFGCLRVI
jgi:hypothetical protein